MSREMLDLVITAAIHAVIGSVVVTLGVVVGMAVMAR